MLSKRWSQKCTKGKKEKTFTKLCNLVISPLALLQSLKCHKLLTELMQLVSSFHQTIQKVTDPQLPNITVRLIIRSLKLEITYMHGQLWSKTQDSVAAVKVG